MKKRRLILLYWIIATTLFIPSVSFAYIDPATTTYLIQIATAIVITIGVSLSIFFYKFRMLFENSKILFSKLKVRFSRRQVDKGSKKNVKTYALELQNMKPEDTGLEYAIPVKKTFPDVVPPDRMRNTTGHSEKEGKIKWLFRDDRKYPMRLLICVLMFAAISFTFIVFGPIDLVLSNENEITFSYLDILEPILFTGLICFLLPTIIFPFFKGRLLDLVLCFAMIILIGGYLQGNYLNIDLGTLTGDAIRWENYGPQMLKNTLIWALVAIGVIGVRYFMSRFWKGICIFVPSLIIIVQLVALVSVLPPEGEEKPSVIGSVHPILTMDGINVVSANNNVIHIVLDRLDNILVKRLLRENPTFFDELDGFTRFTNYTAKYLTTSPSVTELLTGKMYYGETDSKQYYKEAFEEGTLLPDLLSENFDINLFMAQNYAFGNIDEIDEYASNIKEVVINADKKHLAELVLRLSGYRYAPISLKSAFWLSSSQFDLGAIDESEYHPWVDDDVKVYEYLNGHPIIIRDDSKNVYKYIHLRGPHPPYDWDKDLKYISSGGSSAEQVKGTFKIVFDYLDQLKDLGIYEKSTIIITADHGAGDISEYPPVPGLFVKPAGSAGTPIEYSPAPVTTDNLRATINKAAEGKPIKPPEPLDEDAPMPPRPPVAPGEHDYGPTLFEVPERADIVRVLYAYVRVGAGNSAKDSIRIRKYEIRGDAADLNNWTEVERFKVDYWG